MIKVDIGFRYRGISFPDLKSSGRASMAAGLGRHVQKARNVAAAPPPIGSPFKTGHNRRGIGWAVSPDGQAGYQGLRTRAGRVSTDGVPQPPRAEIQALLSTSSGYGGLLEIGTSKMAPRPYLVPAATGKNSPATVAAIRAMTQALKMMNGGKRVTFQAAAKAIGIE